MEIQSGRARLLHLVAGICAAAVLAACGAATGPTQAAARARGVLELGSGAGPALGIDTGSAAGGDSASAPVTWQPEPQQGMIFAPVPIEVADTVVAGQPVPIVVHTVLRDGCWQPDGQSVEQSGLTVDITPEDSYTGGGDRACSDLFGFSAHKVSVTFTGTGVATIRVNGRRIAFADTTTIEPVIVEREIVVR